MEFPLILCMIEINVLDCIRKEKSPLLMSVELPETHSWKQFEKCKKSQLIEEPKRWKRVIHLTALRNPYYELIEKMESKSRKYKDG